jgi:hypothetical protein
MEVSLRFAAAHENAAAWKTKVQDPLAEL